MIQSFAILLACQLVGEIIVHATGAPLPGPVVGLLLLLGILIGLGIRRHVSQAAGALMDSVGRVSDGLLAMLGVLFVPAGVGVIQHLGLIRTEGLALAATLVVSLIVTLVVTAGAFVATTHLLGQDKGHDHHHQGAGHD
jgi:putative effector of murein hydrolase LrgA (UPF0299 family)